MATTLKIFHKEAPPLQYRCSVIFEIYNRFHIKSTSTKLAYSIIHTTNSVMSTPMMAGSGNNYFDPDQDGPSGLLI